MNISVKNGMVGVSNKMIKHGASKPPIKSVVNVSVDPNQKVEIAGSGVKAISKIDPSGKTTRFAKFANFRL